MSMAGFGGEDRTNNEVTLVPGKLRGYRRYRFEPNTGSGQPGRLTALATSAVHYPGENTARCFAWRPEQNIWFKTIPRAFSLNGYDSSEEHFVPKKSCSCGFYGYYTPDRIDQVGGNGTEWTAVAVVEAYGNIILGTKGFRSEKMKALAVVLPPELRQISHRDFQAATSIPFDTTKNISDQSIVCGLVLRDPGLVWKRVVASYGLVEFPSVDELVAAYPPQDVSNLFPEKPEEARSGEACPCGCGAPLYPPPMLYGPTARQQIPSSNGISGVSSAYATPVTPTLFRPLTNPQDPDAS